jgi:hypothetical protein
MAFGESIVLFRGSRNNRADLKPICVLAGFKSASSFANRRQKARHLR